MKRLLYSAVALAAAGSSLQSCANKKPADNQQVLPENAKAIVCYFSATGTTERAAQRIAALTGAATHQIAPAEPYSAADLDWRDSLSRCYVEMHNPQSRPALKDSVTDMSEYSVVFIGYPNWWNTHPTIINTFIESNNLQGKTIVPFMTSGGSTISNSEKELRQAYPSLKFADGLLMNDVSDEEIKSWIMSAGM